MSVPDIYLCFPFTCLVLRSLQSEFQGQNFHDEHDLISLNLVDTQE